MDAKAEEKRRRRNVKISKINQLTVTCCNRNQSSRANDWASWRAGNAKRNGKYRFSSAIFQLYGHLFSFVLCVFCSLLILLVFKSRAKHLSSGCVLSNGITLFAKMWSRFIYHSTIWTQCTFSVHTLGHMWTNFSFFIFKASHLYFLRLFLVLRFEDCCFHPERTALHLSAAKEQTSSWNAFFWKGSECAPHTRDKQRTNVLLLEPVEQF